MRVRVRVLCAAAVAAAPILVLGISDAGAKAKSWVVTALNADDPSAVGTYVADISDTGYVAGSWQGADWYPAYWYRGRFHDLATDVGMPEGYEGGGGIAWAVNNNGYMVGVAWEQGAINPDQAAAAWDVKAGTTRILQTEDPAYFFSTAWAVNADGDAVGYVAEIDDSRAPPFPPFWQSPVLWAHGDDEATYLPIGDYEEGWATGVNSRGTVAGTVLTRGTGFFAAIWTRDSHGAYEMVDLMPALGSGYPYAQAFDVSEDGKVVGHCYSSDFSEHRAFTWTSTGGVTLLEGDNAIAWKAVANYVGGTVGASAAVWLKGTLDVVPASATGYEVNEAYSITKSGVLAGFGYDSSYNTHAWVAEKK